MPRPAPGAALSAALLLALPAAATAAPADVSADAGGLFEFTIEPMSPLIQSEGSIGSTAPYYYFLLTNTSILADNFKLKITNLDQPWFPQVCLDQVCFPDSTTLPFGAGAFDTVGVNVVPLTNGVGQWDFTVSSVGDPGQTATYHLTLFAGTAAVGADALPAAAGLRLSPSFPNPATGPARIAFALPREDRVTLRVFDVAGRVLATLADGTLAAGPHAVQWSGELASGRPAPAGTYFYRLETSQGALSRRLVLLR